MPDLLAWICRAQSDDKFLSQSAYARVSACTKNVVQLVQYILFIYLSLFSIYLLSPFFFLSITLSLFLSGLPFFLAFERFAKEWESNPKN